jgi:hypothetical protein
MTDPNGSGQQPAKSSRKGGLGMLVAGLAVIAVVIVLAVAVDIVFIWPAVLGGLLVIGGVIGLATGK